MEHFNLEPVLVMGIIFWGVIAILREVSQNKLRHRIVDKGMDPLKPALFSAVHRPRPGGTA
jgi:hypothetical protein